MTASVPGTEKGLLLEYQLDAPPEKVWRAITTSELREQWLPNVDLANDEPCSITPQREVAYTIRDTAPPFVESTVIFQIAPNNIGGTCLRIIHERDAGLSRMMLCAANPRVPDRLAA